MNNIDETLKERGSRYGEFPEHASITQGIKDAMSTGRNWDSLDDDMKECLEMVAHKIGRILNGDPRYIDSWTDIIGYTRLVEKRLIDEQATAKIFAFPVGGTTSDHHLDAMPASMPVKGAGDVKSDVRPESEADDCDCIGCLLRRSVQDRIFVVSGTKRTA